MNIIFWADCYTEHQRQLCEELHKRSTSFQFVADRETGDAERLVGKKAEFEPDYVIHIDSVSNKRIAKKLINAADVVIAGRVPLYVIRECTKSGKLVLRYSERPIKRPEGNLEHLLRKAKWHFTQPLTSNVHLLAAGAYTSYDYKKYGLYEGSAYKWGYFPEFIEYEIDNIVSLKRKNSIAWAGRMIAWKHPETVINIARILKNEGYEFDITFIGDGPLRKSLENDCLKYGLNDQVTFTGAIPSIQVRRIMEQASIYICSSDRQEGWGAVVNEAMNSGCAVIADQMIGSAPFLIDSGYNGYTYRSFNELSDVIAKLLNDENECRRIGTNAYMTISEEWNAKEAAKRLIRLIENLLNGHETPFNTGPCSIAEVINGE